MPNRADKPSWAASLMASQRIPPGSHMSAWFHGESVMGKRDEEKRPQGLRKVTRQQEHKPVSTARARYENYSPGLRSPSSTRSLVDPGHSTVNFSRPLTYDPFIETAPSNRPYMHPAFASPATFQHPPDKARTAPGHLVKPKQDFKAQPRSYLPRTKDPRIKQKEVGTFISGTLLMVILTTCQTFHSHASLD